MALTAQEGGPPMLTDDARVADFKEWELNPSINMSVTDRLVLSAPHIDLNYGVLPNLQLKIEAPLLFEFQKNEPGNVGLGELNFGVKYRFLDEEKRCVSAATFPQYAFTGEKGLFLPVFFERSFGRFLLGTAVACFLGADKPDRVELGALSGFRATEGFHLMLEYYNVQNVHQPDGANGYVNLGFRGELKDKLLAMCSFGAQLVAPTSAERERFIAWIGLRTLF